MLDELHYTDLIPAASLFGESALVPALVQCQGAVLLGAYWDRDEVVKGTMLLLRMWLDETIFLDEL